jgi:hypothetical protein
VTLLGKITVTLSDDARYAAGSTYDVVLTTPQTPDPATLVDGTITPPAAEPPASGTVEPPA